MIFYKMNRAGLLQGLPDWADVSQNWILIAVTDIKKADDFEKQHGMKLTVKFRHVPDSFARMLAKIGYGQLLTSLDPGDFRPLCLPYIMGDKTNPSFIVGGSPELPEPIPDVGYSMSTAGYGDTERLLLIAEIRLFANMSTPAYHVVVGDVLGADQISSVLKKLGDIELTIAPLSRSTERNSISLKDHWTPTAWPLPT
jgi:hypothetical protein